MSEPVTVPDQNAPANALEADLVRRARRGELSAYDELVKRYQERIYATIYHMTGNHEDANDLAQESFIKAYSALRSFKGGSSSIPGCTGSPSTKPSISSSSAAISITSASTIWISMPSMIRTWWP